MTVNELYAFLNEMIPPSLSCDWDNDGKMCVPNGNREVRRVLVTLDVTRDAVERAVAGRFDVILSHHPMIFRPIAGIVEDAYVSGKAVTLIQNGISVLSFHTRLDAVRGGVNDMLASMLDVEHTIPFGNKGEEIGRIGELETETSLEEFAEKVRRYLCAPHVLSADAGRPVKRVAVLGGSGGDDLFAAIAAGADTYVSGELKHHQLADAAELGINLIAAGHFYTEDPICERLAEWVCQADDGIYCEHYHSYGVRSVIGKEI